MRVIDGEWIKARLTGRRGEKRDIAEASGLTQKQMTYILNGSRKVSQDEAPRIAAYFGETLPAAMETLRTVTGLQDASRPFLPAPGTLEDTTLTHFRAQGSQPVAYRVSEPYPEFALIPGDTLTIESGDAGSLGDLVVCSITDPEQGTRSWVCKRLDPWLWAGPLTIRVNANDQSVAIYGKVIAVVRSIAPSDAHADPAHS